MMRNTIRFACLFCAIFLASADVLPAQCTPDTTMSSATNYPNTWTNGCVGQAYDQTVYFSFPRDTTISPFGTIVFDSFTVVAASLPPGLSYSCNTAGCDWTQTNTPKNANFLFGCIHVTGTPTGTFAGIATFDIKGCVTVPIIGVQCSTVTQPFNFTIYDSPVAGFSFIVAGMIATFTDNTTGSVTTWSWDFGDGNSSSTQSPAHTYAGPGLYNVCLLADNGNCQDSICQLVTIGCPNPSVQFSHVVNQLSVNFTDITPGSPTAWSWDFGDGNSSTSQNPSHLYLTPGLYTVCLIVTDSCGIDSACDSVNPCLPPVAGFTSNTILSAVAFTDTSGGSPASWMWDFGDGTTDSTQNPSHTYLEDSTYTVCLIVTSSCGSDTSCRQVIIANIPDGFPVNKLSVFPNPAKDRLFVYANSAYEKSLMLEVMDVAGRILKTEWCLNPHGSFDATLDLTDMKSGIYFLVITAAGMKHGSKFVVE